MSSDVDVRALRRVLGAFPTGVTVVTAADGGQVHGMTANAFTSVSLRPPLVLVSIAVTARMNACIERSGHYGVSVLAHDQVAHARRFAGRPVAPDSGAAVPEPVEFVWRDGVPLLAEALMRVSCTVHRVVPAGDHTLFLGEIRHSEGQVGRPLVFFEGRYHELHIPQHSDPWWI